MSEAAAIENQLPAVSQEASHIAIFIACTYLFTWAFATTFGLSPSAK